MVRRGAPALYELMRRPGAPATGADAGAAAPRRAARGPSRPASLELGVGKLAVLGVLVAVAIAAVIAVAYGFGLQRGRALPTASDPAAGGAAAPASSGSTASPSPATAPRSPRIPPVGDRTAPTARRPEVAATDNNGDPRVKGSRYFVLAHPSSQRAAEMVEFCRLNGLDAHLVPDDNALLRKIIVLPGYRDASEKSSPEIKQLEAKVRSVGELWKSKARGNKDFADAYPELFR